jgi:hypothetical protein
MFSSLLESGSKSPENKSEWLITACPGLQVCRSAGRELRDEVEGFDSHATPRPTHPGASRPLAEVWCLLFTGITL